MKQHEYSTFATLTYSDEFVARNELGWTCLDKQHVIALFKKMRKFASFKYYCIGEYGSKTHRAHYHVFFFGLDTKEVFDFLDEFWTYGHCRVTDINGNRIGYVANFHIVANRKTNVYTDQPPEFTLCSKGLGLPSKARIKSIEETHQVSRHGIPYAIPRYWEEKLSEDVQSDLKVSKQRFLNDLLDKEKLLSLDELRIKEARKAAYIKSFRSKTRKNRK